MPFIRKTDGKDSHRAIDARKIFIGRTNELQFFQELILKPENPVHNIVSIHGQGGVGKTTLLLRLIDTANTPDFKDYCLTALVNERQATPAGIIEEFADQLQLGGDFERARRQYKEVLRKLQSQRDTARETLAHKATADVVDSVTQNIPVIGPFLRGGAEVATNYLFEELHYRQLLKDAQQMEDPLSDLTEAFIRELNRLAGTTAVPTSSTRMRRQRRVLLCFDTFEQLAEETAPWLLDSFLEADISTNVVLVLSGRDSLEHSTPEDPKRWLPYRDDHTLHSISLNSFTKEETRIYLAERGITSIEHTETIWQLSRGLPLYLGFLTADPEGRVDPTASVVANFLRWIPQQEKIKHRLALDAALFSRPFNQDELGAFDYITEQERPTLYRWLIAQPFVQSNLQDGRYIYHELAQELFSRHLYQLSPNDWRATHKALATYYMQRLKDMKVQGGKEEYNSAQWLELALALAKQLFLLSDEACHIRAIELVIDMFEHATQIEDTVRMLRELSQGPSDGQVCNEVRQIAAHVLLRFEGDSQTQEPLTGLNYLLEKVTREPSCPSRLLAWFYNDRGDVYNTQERYEEALTNYNRAIELNPDLAHYYYNRGGAYDGLKNYEEALADYNRAIRLNPNAAGYYSRRGNVHYIQECYEEALADYNRAIGINPNAAVYYYNRGGTYYQLKMFEEALADFAWAIELNPNDADYYNQRGNVYQIQERYEEALADFNRAATLNEAQP